MISISRPAALIRVTGDDAFTFLQGQFTNELRQAPGSATYGLWLNQKGKVVADSHVLRLGENEFLLISGCSTASVIQKRLEDYIVADDVVLQDETALKQGFTLWGPKATTGVADLLGELPQAGRFLSKDDLLIFRGRWLSGESYVVLGPEKRIRELSERLAAGNFIQANHDEKEFARISAGIPVVPQDLGPGDLPNEGGLEETAISFTKGCYLGQEVMARLKNLGQVRRRLQVLHGRGTVPAPLSSLYQGEKRIGEVRSVATEGDGFVVLAMLSLVNLDPAAGLGLAPGEPSSLILAAHG